MNPSIIKRFWLKAYFPMFLIMLGQSFTLPVLPLYIGSLGASLSLTGFIISFIGIGTFLADLPAGSLVSRIGPKRVSVYSCIAVTAAAIGIGLASRLWVIIFFLLVLGMGQSAFVMALHVRMRAEAALNERGRSLSLMGGVLRIANLIGPAAGGYTARLLGLGFPFLVQGGLALCTIILLYVDRSEKPPAEEGNSGSLGKVYTDILKNNWKVYLTTGIVIVVLIILRTGRDLIVPLWGKHIGLDVAAIGFIMSAGAAAEIPMVIPAGHIMDRFGRKWAAGPCILILSLGLVLLPLTVGYLGFLLAVLLISVGNSFGAGIILTLGADAAPDENTGEFLGILRLIGDVGRISAPLLIGLFAGVLSLAVSPLVLAGFGFFGLWVLIAKMRDTYRR